MATVYLKLETRRPTTKGLYKIVYCISHAHKTSYIYSNVEIELAQWDEKNKRIKSHPNATSINRALKVKLLNIEDAIEKIVLSQDNGQRLTVLEIKEKVLEILYPKEEEVLTFYSRYIKFMNDKTGRTREIYESTLSKILKFDKEFKTRTFEDINRAWLQSFCNFMQDCSVNTQSIHLRNIRAVFNDAIDDDVTNIYPFRKFKIKREETIKRSLTIKQLRTLWNADVTKTEKQYLDIFKLIFLLIGINSKDLFNLKEIVNGRVEYKRAKTKRLYSVKVEPEALSIIEQYRGENYLLNILDRYKNHDNYRGKLNKYTIDIAKRNGLPKVTTYWARHTWATIAAELDIPKETISEALGHQLGSRITSIYINFDQRKVDEANRKVIDYLLSK